MAAMDELKDFFETLIKALPLHAIDEDLAGIIRDGLNSKAAKAVESIIKRIEAAAPQLQGPISGAPVDEDLPPLPANWTHTPEAAPEPAAPVAPVVPLSAGPQVTTPEVDQGALDSALGKLAAAPGVAALPSLTHEQLAEAAAAATPPGS
jgi:hypothetical protein